MSLDDFAYDSWLFDNSTHDSWSFGDRTDHWGGDSQNVRTASFWGSRSRITRAVTSLTNNPSCTICDPLSATTDAHVSSGRLAAVPPEYLTQLPSTDGMAIFFDKELTSLCMICTLCVHRINDPLFNDASLLVIDSAQPAELAGLTALEIILVTRRFYTATLFIVDDQSQANLVSILLPARQEGDLYLFALPLTTQHLRDVLQIFRVPSHHHEVFAGNCFRVRRQRVGNALRWLQFNNPHYHDIQIDHQALHDLPIDDQMPGLSLYDFDVHMDRAPPRNIITSPSPTTTETSDGPSVFQQSFPDIAHLLDTGPTPSLTGL
ncbi:hypothetical protein Hypma_006697 [Hypsizygus marmoreus]|uniref:DUF6570 domain-containing protein n=1 Tax=Hypsizygus marmoreus TaxID=39966 RepID=A0A369JYV8_HYPMA|nr:hypothetical protein Hypma_006697 [Hypsizygus marmoreus]